MQRRGSRRRPGPTSPTPSSGPVLAAGRGAGAQVMGVLAAVEELDDRPPGRSLGFESEQVELAPRPARARAPGRRVRPQAAAATAAPGHRRATAGARRTLHQPISVGRAKRGRVRDHRAGVDAEPLLDDRAVEAAEVRGRAQVVVGVELRRGQGTRRSSAPLTWVPITKAAPPAPWSVPESFSSGRRPNSDQTRVITRSASPRASRSAWKAAIESAVSLRGRRRSCSAWLSWVSKSPGR